MERWGSGGNTHTAVTDGWHAFCTPVCTPATATPRWTKHPAPPACRTSGFDRSRRLLICLVRKRSMEEGTPPRIAELQGLALQRGTLDPLDEAALQAARPESVEIPASHVFAKDKICKYCGRLIAPAVPFSCSRSRCGSEGSLTRTGCARRRQGHDVGQADVGGGQALTGFAAGATLKDIHPCGLLPPRVLRRVPTVPRNSGHTGGVSEARQNVATVRHACMP